MEHYFLSFGFCGTMDRTYGVLRYNTSHFWVFFFVLREDLTKWPTLDLNLWAFYLNFPSSWGYRSVHSCLPWNIAFWNNRLISLWQTLVTHFTNCFTSLLYIYYRFVNGISGVDGDKIQNFILWTWNIYWNCLLLRIVCLLKVHDNENEIVQARNITLSPIHNGGSSHWLRKREVSVARFYFLKYLFIFVSSFNGWLLFHFFWDRLLS